MHRKIPVLMILFLVFLSGCSVQQSGRDEELTELTDRVSEEVPEEEPDEEFIEGTKEEGGQESAEYTAEPAKDTEEIYVHVCGQVQNPGVYLLPAKSRMFEAIDAAGGLLADAADELLNQAAQVKDGQQIYVPSREEAMQGMASQNMSNSGEGGQGISNPAALASQPAADLAADDGKVNLNIASKEQLMTLSGIGEAKASSIIAYREAHGGFKRIEELMEVEGIKEGVFNKVKDQIKVS